MKNPTSKQLEAELFLEKPAARAAVWLMRNSHNITDVFNYAGWLYEDDKVSNQDAYRKLKPFESDFNNVWQGPTNIPQDGPEQALRLIESLTETLWVEHLCFENKEGDRVTFDYCNTGCMDAWTLYYDYGNRVFCLGTYSDIRDTWEGKEYRLLENYEI
jgi:hypothetical protein